MTPWMTPDQIEYIKTILKPEHTVLEWGSGGSTVTFSPLVSEWYSIEHNSQYFAKVKKEIPDNVNLINVKPDIKLPKRPSKAEDWTTYINACHTFGKQFDVVLIDGRARPECAKEALKVVKPDGIVIVHDFYDKLRPHYKVILDDYTLLKRVGKARSGMAVLCRK